MTFTLEPSVAALTAAVLAQRAAGIDHIAIAVPDLEAAVTWYVDVLGFTVAERRETQGNASGMVSAVLKAGSLNFVLVQGTSPESQVSQFVRNFGPGVQHVAIAVDNLPEVAAQLRAAGMEFATNIIQGGGLTQIFSRRDPHSGMMYEFIERTPGSDFSDQSVAQLFEQLESQQLF